MARFTSYGRIFGIPGPQEELSLATSALKQESQLARQQDHFGRIFRNVQLIEIAYL
jgi:hypothetical protein